MDIDWKESLWNFLKDGNFLYLHAINTIKLSGLHMHLSTYNFIFKQMVKILK